MSNFTRRHFLGLATGAVTASVVGYYLFAPSTKQKIVIIGGGAVKQTAHLMSHSLNRTRIIILVL